MNELKLREIESELTPIEIALQIDKDGRTTARKLYDFLDLAKGQFSRWAKSNITNNSFAEEGNDYIGFDINVEGNNVKDFRLSAEFAKKLAMSSHTAKGEEARNYFIQVEDKLKEVAKTMQIILSDKDKAILNIVKARSDIEKANAIAYYDKVVTQPLLEQVDKYERFLCEKTGCLTKSELAVKLDASPQTVAAKLKKANVYTPTSKVREDFLKKFPDIKLIVDRPVPFTNPKTHELEEKIEWQWTYEGAKTLVDYLIYLGMVTYTDNNGFKLNRA